MKSDLAIATAQNLLLRDPESEERIRRGIEENRKGVAAITLKGADGKPVQHARVKARLLRHEFRFGANCFMLDQFRDAEKDREYRQRFADVFNLAVIPFYWRDTEPERGKPRFSRDSPYVYRRPPTDLALEFCEEHGITPKGHPLCWHAFLPKWASFDKKQLAEETERRIEEIAERYGKRIRIWDVCNEAVCLPVQDVTRRTPDRHVELAFEVATRSLPRTSELIYNDYACWENHGEYTAMYMLCRHLKQMQHLNFGGIGLQYHMFEAIEQMANASRHMLNTRNILDMLDLYGKLGVPVNISEITLSAHPAFGDGPGFQNEVAEHLYRLWFSHPALNAIVYWNLVDDTAYVNPDNPAWNENTYKGGLLNNDLTPKPAYETLRRLIHEEWQTRTEVEYLQGEENRFRGFYGDYELTIETTTGVFRKEIRMVRGGLNQFLLELN